MVGHIYINIPDSHNKSDIKLIGMYKLIGNEFLQINISKDSPLDFWLDYKFNIDFLYIMKMFCMYIIIIVLVNLNIIHVFGYDKTFASKKEK